jgi:hypothetical protein
MGFKSVRREPGLTRDQVPVSGHTRTLRIGLSFKSENPGMSEPG